MKRKRNGFTLIELIAVLVIMAIIALIVTPLVMNIIRKSKISARKRSVDAYGRSVELAIASYLLDTGTFPTDLHSLIIEYSGNTVACNVMQMKENGGLYMSECSVNNVEVKDSHTDDGWYHYGIRDITNEEYVDMYGKNVEAALKLYHDTNNAYPEAIDTLTIESVGKTVACESSVNYDGTVYLTNCKVDGVSVSDTNQEDGYYHYGNAKKNTYSVGDLVTYNGVDYYVIKDSGLNDTTVTMLKKEMLTNDEIVEYSNGIGNKGSGYIQYGQSTDYSKSYVKTTLDNWILSNFILDNLDIDSTGYSVRLLTKDEYNLISSFNKIKLTNNYWIMTPYKDDTVWFNYLGNLMATNCMCDGGICAGIRPVITIKKSAL